MRNRTGLAGRYFMIYFPVTMLTLVLLVVSTLNVSRDLLEKAILNRSTMLVEVSNRYLNLYTENLRNLFLFIRSEQDVFTLPAEAVRSRLIAYYEANPTVINTLYLVDSAGGVVSSRQALYDLFGSETIASILRELDNGSGTNWTARYHSPVSGTTVSFVMKTQRGSLVADIRLDLLYEQLRGRLNVEGQTVIVTSAEDKLIAFDELGDLVRPRVGSYPADLPQELLDLIAAQHSGVSRIRYMGRPFILLRSGGNALGWNLYVLVDTVTLSAELEPLYANFRRIGLLLLLLSILSSVLLSLVVARPIRRVAGAMDRVTSLKGLTPIENRYRDELADLVDSYNSLMNRASLLTSEKHEFEWRMLQSQIGPHFLYNTLGCIAALAQRYKVQEVQETTRALVDLLRYSFDRGREEVTLREEVEVLRKYVSIQNIRYGHLVTLREDISADVEEILLPALLLQPIVENAVFHGIVPAGRKGEITIRARLCDGEARIQIVDDGRGIAGEELKAIQASLTAQDAPLPERPRRNDRFSAIGLRNIQDRLLIHYGAAYGVTLESEEGAGTAVTLRLPAVRPGSGS